jgi:FkbM family methyltransferase
MISYAQNGEDVLLARVFDETQKGFYVDVGAGHPWVDSVTCHFYLQGWTGLNIEPRGEIAELLAKWRPLDKLANCCVSDHPGTVEFFEVNLANSKIGDGGGLSTVDAELAAGYLATGFEVKGRTMPMVTLASLCEQYDLKEIDFLKVDVEGHESQVILSGDWQRWRPRVVIVESITPIDHREALGSWREFLQRNDYFLASFDGINSYYVRGEDKHLLAKFRSPVSILDEYKTWQTCLYEEQLRAKYGRRWRRRVATNLNVPAGLKPDVQRKSIFRRLLSA